MVLRHLRCFLAMAEELHFACAAEKLHIEQSPLSRAIKELEEDLDLLAEIRKPALKAKAANWRPFSFKSAT